MEIRPPLPEEFAALAALTVAAYRSVGGWILDDDYAAELADVAGRVRAADVLVAIIEGRLAGGVTYVGDHTNPYAEELRIGEAGMRMLAVEGDLRGRGAGRALTKCCVDLACRAGRQSLVLHSTPWMTDAHRLYERLGFVRAPERDWRPAPEVPLLAFVLDLHAGAEPAAPSPASVGQ